LFSSPDVEGNTPLHNAIRSNNTRVTDRLVQYLADTDFDNHIRYINRKIPKLVELVPLQMMAYFDKRIKTTTWVENYIRGKVENLPDCDFNITCEGMWNDKIDHENRKIHVPRRHYREPSQHEDR